MRTAEIKVSPAFAMGVGLVIALDPAQLWLPFFLAVFAHEAGHLLCLLWMRIPPQGIQIGFTGAVLDTAPLSAWQEGLCAAAGPLVNLLLGLLFFRILHSFALLNLLLAGYNLLPVFPLDGGRIVRVLFPETAETVFAMGTVLLLTAGCVWTAVLHRGLWPLMLLGIMLAKIALQRFREQKLFANRPSSVYNIQR